MRILLYKETHLRVLSVRSSMVAKQTAACVQMLETLCSIEGRRLMGPNQAGCAEQNCPSHACNNWPDTAADASWSTPPLGNPLSTVKASQSLSTRSNIDGLSVLQTGQYYTPKVQPWYLHPKSPAAPGPIKRQRMELPAEQHSYSQPHISLSRLVTLQYHLLSSFVLALKTGLKQMRRYSCRSVKFMVARVPESKKHHVGASGCWVHD